jgi:hypothetical protein
MPNLTVFATQVDIFFLPAINDEIQMVLVSVPVESLL